MKYTIDNNIIFLSLTKGEEINQSILRLAKQEDISSCWINGIGAIGQATIGYYSIEKKIYERKLFKNDYELTSLMGNISIKNGDPFVHNHVTFTDKKYNSIGGHLFSATITATGEFFLFLGKSPILRDFNDDIGIPLWCL